MAAVEEVEMETEVVQDEGKVTGFLTFFLGSEQYGIEILKVQEIIGLLPITRVPRTRDFIKGVVNLRGKVIPVLDVRERFRMEAREPTEESCIIFVHVGDAELGILVDRVSEVLDIKESLIEDPEVINLNGEQGLDCLQGIAKLDGSTLALLNLEKLCRF